MKAKTSATLLVAFFFITTQLALRAQNPDCYNIQCPSKIIVPCEGVFGGHAWYSVTVTTLCVPAPAPTITYSVPPGSLFPPGTSTVCATIQIPGSPPQQCCFDVIVDNCCNTNCIDVICPSNIVVGCQPAGAAPGAFVNLPRPIATNYCGDHLLPAILTWRCFPEAPSGGGPLFFPPGTNTVVCCYGDGKTDLKCCSFQVMVENCPPVTDQCRPQIICPKETQISCVGGNGAVVFFPPPQIIDPCGFVVATNSTHSSGTLFPNGKTTVAYCITWQNPATGLTGTECCTFDVVVRCCPPTNCVSTLLCPTNVVVDCPTAAAGSVLNYTVFGTNTCGPTTVVCDPPPGTVITGPLTVCCRLLNSGGIVLTQCCFNVTLNDTTPPQIQCPPDITVTSPNCQPVPVALPVIIATDNCDPHPVVTCTPNLNLFPCGVTKITCTATDVSGNSNQCIFLVRVICGAQIICPPDMVIRCASPTGVVVNYNVTITNQCDPAIGIICDPPSGSVFLPGSYAVCCRVLDSGATSNGCCFKVTVEADDVPPSIICPSNIVVTSPNCGPREVVYPQPEAKDNCALDSVVCLPPSGSLFGLGTTAVTCCARDKAGNSNCCNFTITLNCPSNCIQVVCPSNIVVECAGPNGAPVFFKAYASNICTGVEMPVICTPPSGSIFPPGITQVCCTNAPTVPPFPTGSGYCCFTVTVRPDTTPPTILCPSNIVVNSSNCNSVDVLYPAPVATDDCGLDSVACTPPSGSPFMPGVTTVTCCARDKAGNTNCCSFTVSVICPNDCIRVVCPTNVVVDCAGPNGAPVTFTAVAIDTCTGLVTPLTCSKPSGSIFPPGVTTVCCTNKVATAAAPQWCCFDVTVKADTQPPVINCSSNIYVLCAGPRGAKVTYHVTAQDNCDAAPVVTCIPPSGSLFRLGCTNVTCVATDSAGNSSTCSFKVCVLPQGCYLRNPSFELVNAVAPPANFCGDPIALAPGWTALAGNPALFRPPFASMAPGNCRGQEDPCQGTNYAGLQGGYTTSGGFSTEAMMGTLVAPLNNGQLFRLRACLSLADNSTGPMLVEFVLSNSANPAQEHVIHAVLVTQKKGWMHYLPPCFRVPEIGNWDRLIIRAAQVAVGGHLYPAGYVYVDNVNICCCKPILRDVVVGTTTVTVTWDGAGQLQAANAFGDPADWRNVDSPGTVDPDTGMSQITIPRPPTNLIFRVLGPDGTIECAECGTGG